MLKPIPTIVMILLLVACVKQPPEEPVESQEFARIYADLVAEEALHPEEFDSLRSVILSRYGVTPARFRQAENYYRDHPETWVTVMETVMVLLKARLDTVGVADSQAVKIDTVRIPQ